MRTITIELPDAAQSNDFDTRMRVAVSLYNQDILLLSECAAVAGISKREFIEQAGAFGGLRMGPQSITELERDLRNA